MSDKSTIAIGPGIGAWFPIGDQYSNYFLQIPQVKYFLTDSFFLQNSLNFGLEKSTDCTSTGVTSYAKGEEIENFVCKKNGRVNLSGGVGLGLFLFKSDEVDLAIGGKAEIGHYFKAKNNPGNEFHSGNLFLELILGRDSHPQGSLSVFGGYLCEFGESAPCDPVFGLTFGGLFNL